MANYIKPISKVSEDLDENLGVDTKGATAFEKSEEAIDISHFGSFKILKSSDEMRIRAKARQKELKSFRDRMLEKKKKAVEKAKAKARRTDNFLKLKSRMKQQARVLNEQQSIERNRLKEELQKLVSRGALLSQSSLDSFGLASKSVLAESGAFSNEMLGFQNSSLLDTDQNLVEEGDEYFDGENANNILDMESDKLDMAEHKTSYTECAGVDSLDRVVYDFETGEQIQLMNDPPQSNRRTNGGYPAHLTMADLPSGKNLNYESVPRNDEILMLNDDSSSIISIKNRPYTVQSLRRQKRSQVTMQTRRPRPSYGKQNIDLINERIERIRIGRSKTAKPKKRREPEPLLGNFQKSSSSGFLPGPKARRKLGRQARHVNAGNLANRHLKQPRPKSFFQKEFAKHSMQSVSFSALSNSNQISDGIEQLEAVRQRQLASMDRLLKEEREVEVQRQAMEASDTSKSRRRRLQLKFVKDREKSRHRILRIAKEHELALASRMAAMGLIR